MNILDQIVANKNKEIEKSKQQNSISELEKKAFFSRDCISLKQRLILKSGIIAEFKRQSPSKGIINDRADITEVVQDYEKAGVSALSILTDQVYFGGSNIDILTVRQLVNLPILRKEFIVDAYQIYEAKAIGADAILLIASILDGKKILEFSRIAKSLGLEILLEVHNEEELSVINKYIDCVGVNNRNLKDFTVDIQNSIELSEMIPDEFVKVSESGISTVASIKALQAFSGFEGFLIGENFMKKDDPGRACHAFIEQLSKSKIHV